MPSNADADELVVHEFSEHEYHVISTRAVLGLVFGLFAWLAMISPLLWIVPALGVALSLLALRAIAASDGALEGRRLAVAGLALSLLFGAAAPAALLSDGWWLRREAQPIAQHWFELLRDDQPQQAHQLTISPHERQAESADLWSYYRGSSDARMGLERFVNAPLVRALLALGPKAKVRYYATEGHGHYDGKQQVSQYYAVTYPEGDERHTFFAHLVLERTTDPDTGQGRWQVSASEGGVSPFAWEKK